MVPSLLAFTYLATEVLAVVNGKPITREELEKALNEGARQGYRDAVSDLRDYEHAAVRDYLGGQAVERDARDQDTAADSIYARVMASNFDHFDPNLRNRIQQQRERVFTTERAALDDLVQKRLFESAARARGMTSEELMRKLTSQITPVTKTDLDFLKAYEGSKQQVSVTIAPGEPRLEAAIRSARIEQLRLSVIDSIRGQAKVESRLAPPRVSVSTAGAARVGSPSAAVQIVVFTDFECPYCREAEQTLSHIRQKYGDQVALYYLNYPLPSHPNAPAAAKAAVCAAAQGRYSAYHDVLFTHQEDLAHGDYAAWAVAAGLDRAVFEKCRSSDNPQRRVEQDIREGIAAGVAGTPTFLVNGRLVRDNEALPAIVAEELAASR
jgi:protein-disulfide isomerase